MVQMALHRIIHSEVALRGDALCEAVSLKVGDKWLDKESICDEETILAHCSSLVRRNAAQNCLELAHFTVQEFLIQIQPNSLYSPYAQVGKEVYPLLAKICLTYVNMDTFQGHVIEDWDEWNMQQVIHPFRAHAVRYWVRYAENSWEDDEFLAFTYKLFDPSKTLCFLSWARDYLYVCNHQYVQEYENRLDAFGSATEIICMGGVTSLHLAAALGFPEICQWLLTSGCHINQASDLGTPLHCSLAGAYALSDALSEADWLLTEYNNFRREGRKMVLQMLLANEAELTSSYRDPFGTEYSCAKLALHANLGKGAEHPLILLVATGAKLDRGLLTAFENWSEAKRERNDHDGYDEEFIRTLIENLKDNTLRADLLTVALRFKSSATFSTLNSKKKMTTGTIGLEREELYNLFVRAIRFDQIDVMEDLLQDDRLVHHRTVLKKKRLCTWLLNMGQ
jgi:hypothetical protein